MKGLAMFDYDWSLINDDSDCFVYKQLQPELLAEFKACIARGDPFSKTADAILSKLTCSKDKLLETMARVPVQPGMLDAVHAAHAKGWDVAIVSDANTVFIRCMLEFNSLTSIVRYVRTNPASFQGNTLRVKPFHSMDKAPHGCPRCPSNMCKGAIIRDLLTLEKYSKVLYVGDGGGDYCPALTQLTSRDVVFARENCELLNRIRHEPVRATVVPWSTGYDILAGFQAHLS
ncbi:hypothetical protein AeRB84_003253 [Aphanomyces euteiches]|nr:hypothetical protein AeRB84_003253 [Aphanomyces euteiches]